MSTLNRKPDSARAIVIGSGFGGLASAIRLQAAGYRVTLFEAREQLGGRAAQLREGGYTFDMGPTLITAPHLLRDLWATAGRDFDFDVPMRQLDPFYRIHFRDGRTFEYGRGAAEDEAQVAAFNPADVEGLRRFLAATERIHRRAFDDLAGQPFDDVRAFARVIPELARLGAQRSVYDYVASFIQDPRLRMVFSFHPLFIGGNPLRASAIYSIVPYLERQGGVHFAMGGMSALVQGMATVLGDLGGEIITGAPVERILVDTGRVSGVRVGNDDWRAPIVVANGDPVNVYRKLVPRELRRPLTRARLKRYRYSMSCFLLYLGLNRTYPQLAHHTIAMPDDYERHLRQVFDGRGLPDDLALYLHAPTRSDPSMAPPGGESLYVLAPVPHLGHGVDWPGAGDELRRRIMRTLEQQLGLDGLEASIVVERRFTPLDFEAQYGAWLGSAFSIEPTLLQSAWLRPHNRSRQLPGLYLAGAGTHPGAGLPGTLLSAAITSRLIETDHPLAAGRRPSMAPMAPARRPRPRQELPAHG